MASTSTSRPFPGFSSVYSLGDSFSGSPFRANIEVTREQGIGLSLATMTLPRPVKARWAMGRKKPSDFIGATLAAPLLVSERVVTVLRDKGFTGWSTYDVELFGHDGAPIPGYHGLSIYGRCGDIDDTRSIEIPMIRPGGVFPYYFGLYFDANTWDGSDIFMPEGRGWRFVVEDVKRAFEKAKLKNMTFQRLVDVERMRGATSL